MAITKGLCILGSTGSVGQNSLRVVNSLPGHFWVIALCAGRNLDVLARQILEFQPQMAVVGHRECVEPLRERLRASGYTYPTKLGAGLESQVEAATLPDVHCIVSASHGTTGLVATYEAVRAGKQLCLANKEVLVTAGELVMRAARERGIEVLPVDSEHCAVHQCLRTGRGQEVRRLILTGSGGPFLKTPKKHFRSITPEQALKHPVWKMGGRITIDSATLMNKGLEIIEAHWLFNLPPSQIDVLIHPESIIHSMVEFQDGSTMAQLSVPDMRIPIQYALTYPERWVVNGDSLGLDLVLARQLHFQRPDTKRFPCLELAREALSQGGMMPCALNAADEIAVEAFLDHRLAFIEIPRVIEKVLKQMPSNRALNSLDDVLECDREARHQATELIEATSV
jgi:1-deoxy-D-xylulose-5-phosphate reductoisomerase